MKFPSKVFLMVGALASGTCFADSVSVESENNIREADRGVFDYFQSFFNNSKQQELEEKVHQLEDSMKDVQLELSILKKALEDMQKQGSDVMAKERDIRLALFSLLSELTSQSEQNRQVFLGVNDFLLTLEQRTDQEMQDYEAISNIISSEHTE